MKIFDVPFVPAKDIQFQTDDYTPPREMAERLHTHHQNYLLTRAYRVIRPLVLVSTLLAGIEAHETFRQRHDAQIAKVVFYGNLAAGMLSAAAAARMSRRDTESERYTLGKLEGIIKLQ